MNIANIKYPDISNGSGCRLSLFISGCPLRCKGCFNKNIWSYDYGKPITESTLNDMIDKLNKSYINGMTILGGEPLAHRNINGIISTETIVTAVKNALPTKNIWLYTGYTWKYLIDIINGKTVAKPQHTPDDAKILSNILQNVDIIVDGPFELNKRDISLKFRGSSNQRIINAKESLKQNKIIVIPDNDIL